MISVTAQNLHIICQIEQWRIEKHLNKCYHTLKIVDQEVCLLGWGLFLVWFVLFCLKNK